MSSRSGRNSRLRLVQAEKPPPRPRRRRRLKRTFFFFLLLLAAAGLAFLLYKGLESFCRVEQITVTGAQRLGEEAIIDCCGVKKGTSLLLLRRRQAEQRLEQLPEIDTAAVTGAFPNRVQIRVQEREPVASLLDRSSFWLLDREGVIFAEQALPAENLPVITGAASEEIVPGKALTNGARHEALLAFLEALSENPLLAPAELNLEHPTDLLLYTADGRKVFLGDREKMVQKLALLWESIPHLPKNGAGSSLDLRAGDRLVIIAE